MPAATPCTATLLTCLHAEIDTTSAYIDLLEQEAALLTDSASLDALPALTQAKQASADALITLARTRAQHMCAANNADSYARTNAAAAGDDDLWQAWHTLLDLAEQAHNLNLRNGALIDVHLRHTRQSLTALRAAMGLSELYTDSGKPQVMGNRAGRSMPIRTG